MLAYYDTGHNPDSATEAPYQAALNGLKPLCTEDEYKLAGEIWASWKDFKAHGVTDETNLTLIGHIRESIPGKHQRHAYELRQRHGCLHNASRADELAKRFGILRL